MSGKAIKSFFESSKRRKVMPQSPNKKVCIEEQIVLTDEQKLKDTFEMIKNWEGSQYELISFYNNLDEEHYQYVLANREDLTFETRLVLWPDEFNPPLGRNCNLKVVELTEEGYRRLLLDKMKNTQKLIDEEIEKRRIPSMPKSDLEDSSVELKKTLETKEKELENAKKSVDTGKYMTPSKRLSVVESNPKVIELTRLVQQLKNELEKTDQCLKVLRDEWEGNQRFKLRHKIEQELAVSGM